MGIIEAIRFVTRGEEFEKEYQEGYKEGAESACKEAELKFVKSLLLESSFDKKKIAFLAEVTESFVDQVKQDILDKLNALR